MANREAEGVAMVLISSPEYHTIGILPRRGDRLINTRGRGLPPLQDARNVCSREREFAAWTMAL